MLRSLIQKLHQWRRLLLALYVMWVLVLTLAPLPAAAGRMPDWFDKVVHLGLFLGFAALLSWNVAGRWARGVVIVGASVVFAGTIELVQGPLAFRSGDVWDFLWGMAGAGVGYAAALVVFER